MSQIYIRRTTAKLKKKTKKKSAHMCLNIRQLRILNSCESNKTAHNYAQKNAHARNIVRD
jgi:hypothetical protein